MEEVVVEEEMEEVVVEEEMEEVMGEEMKELVVEEERGEAVEEGDGAGNGGRLCSFSGVVTVNCLFLAGV